MYIKLLGKINLSQTRFFSKSPQIIPKIYFCIVFYFASPPNFYVCYNTIYLPIVNIIKLFSFIFITIVRFSKINPNGMIFFRKGIELPPTPEGYSIFKDIVASIANRNIATKAQPVV